MLILIHTSQPELSKPLRLPAELDALIMSFLSADPRSLKNAALTCRPWLAAARPYIFRHVQVVSQGQMERLVCASWFSPVISECIRTVRIGDPTTFDFMQDNSVLVFIFSLANMPIPLRNLCALEIHNVGQLWDAKTITQLSRLSSVVSLTFGKCAFSADEFCAIVFSFPNLLHLKIEYCGSVFLGRLKHAALPRQCNPGLISLSIDDKCCLKEGLESLLDCLLSSRSRSTLRSVKFMISQDSVQAVGEFLWALGPHVEKLDLGFWLHVDTIAQICSKALQYVDLQHNTNLRELTLHDPSFPLVQGLLAQVNAPRLHQIALRWAPKAFACANRAVLASVLATPKFRSVRKMKFVYDGSYDATMEPRMRSAFKALDERGILHVSSAA
ncbi:hypothetical protein EUX98_g6884 [Antrodiella citrinella]|uniref:F-box domain-containing protein n=1 Tax=Antrodiella citrinella TaxID=2447956 RepID=A0A4S4MN22_9APHY|nr:hypothetical protein EUX98_g6884 [Antrodiella citrinella]